MRLNRTIVVGTGSSPNAYLGILSYWSNSMKHLRSMIIMKQIRGKSKITGRFQRNSWMKNVRSVLWQGIVMEVTDVLRREDRYICICVHTMILPERSRASVEDVAPVRSWLVVRSWRKRKKEGEGEGERKRERHPAGFVEIVLSPFERMGKWNRRITARYQVIDHYLMTQLFVGIWWMDENNKKG